MFVFVFVCVCVCVSAEADCLLLLRPSTAASLLCDNGMKVSNAELLQMVSFGADRVFKSDASSQPPSDHFHTSTHSLLHLLLHSLFSLSVQEAHKHRPQAHVDQPMAEK